MEQQKILKLSNGWGGGAGKMRKSIKLLFTNGKVSCKFRDQSCKFSKIHANNCMLNICVGKISKELNLILGGRDVFFSSPKL